MNVFSFCNLPKEPTRVTKTSETTVDLIVTNSKTRVLRFGAEDPYISDHSLVQGRNSWNFNAEIPITEDSTKQVVFRSLKNFVIDDFHADLQNTR